jgi:photosystem II stability/assembly factor-like uncharacterized protein
LQTNARRRTNDANLEAKTMREKKTLLLGTHKGLLIYKRRGKSWQFVRESFVGVRVPYAMVDPRTGMLWATLDHGHWGQKLHRSKDMGESWEEVPAPKYPEGATLNANAMEPERPPAPATVRYLWCVAPGGNDQPKRMYIGTEPGGLFVSDDGGATWAMNAGLWAERARCADYWVGGGRDHAGIDAIFVDPRNSQRVLVAVSVAGVFETVDGGATWQPRNVGLKANYLPKPDVEVGHDPHFMAVCPANPDVLWQQNHCGIFRSTDGAKTWHDVSQPDAPAYFGFPISADERDPQTAWVIPAVSDEIRVAVNGAMCVSRTTDGGKTWQAFRKGLPQERSYDVVFRHALDVTGDSLTFGTTTGNVFFSNDRGESWKTLGSHFPLVYSVRFA